MKGSSTKSTIKAHESWIIAEMDDSEEEHEFDDFYYDDDDNSNEISQWN